MNIRIKTFRQRLVITSVAASITFVATRRAFAASAGMPWESPLERIVQILTGPLPRLIGIAVIIMAAFGMTLSESNYARRRLFRFILGFSIALTASAFGLQLLGFFDGFQR